MATNIHPSLKSNLYKLALQLLKNNKPFTLHNKHNETKTFIPGSVIYNVKYLQFYFKFGFDDNEPITDVTL